MPFSFLEKLNTAIFFVLLSFSLQGAFTIEADADAAVPWQLGLQDPATPVMRGILHFHHDLMVIFVFICVFVTFMLMRAVQPIVAAALIFPCF